MLSKNMCWKCELHYFGKNYVPGFIPQKIMFQDLFQMLYLFYLIFYELGPIVIWFKEKNESYVKIQESQAFPEYWTFLIAFLGDSHCKWACDCKYRKFE